MQDMTDSAHAAKVQTRLSRHTKKITATLYTDVASATFVRLLRTVTLGAFNTFGISFQNISGDSIANSVLNLFHGILQEV